MSRIIQEKEEWNTIVPLPDPISAIICHYTVMVHESLGAALSQMGFGVSITQIDSKINTSSEVISGMEEIVEPHHSTLLNNKKSFSKLNLHELDRYKFILNDVEAMYLAETRLLHVYSESDTDNPMTLEQLLNIFIKKNNRFLLVYKVYTHLKAQG